MKILIDNGHGENTPGKRSPDGLFREYKFVREIAGDIERELRNRGYDAERIVKESIDVPLSERSNRVNEICKKLGAANVILISIHCNAAGDGSEWKEARGWATYTSKGKTKADKLADYLYKAAEENFSPKLIRRDYSDGDPDWEEGFHMLNKTKCAAVLTENFFMDNQKDVSYLLSLEGRTAVVRTHIEGVINYIQSIGR